MSSISYQIDSVPSMKSRSGIGPKTEQSHVRQLEEPRLIQMNTSYVHDDLAL